MHVPGDLQQFAKRFSEAPPVPSWRDVCDRGGKFQLRDLRRIRRNPASVLRLAQAVEQFVEFLCRGKRRGLFLLKLLQRGGNGFPVGLCPHLVGESLELRLPGGKFGKSLFAPLLGCRGNCQLDPANGGADTPSATTMAATINQGNGLEPRNCSSEVSASSGGSGFFMGESSGIGGIVTPCPFLPFGQVGTSLFLLLLVHGIEKGHVQSFRRGSVDLL